MARDHARVLTKIWRDDDEWRQLPIEAQHAYLMLLSQPTLSYAGTLSLTFSRWARMTTGQTVDSVEKAVRLLEDRRFVVIDWDTEELMIRTFLRNDGIYRQPNPLKAAMRVAREQVESDLIRTAMAEELRRVGRNDLADYLNPSGNPSRNPLGDDSDTLDQLIESGPLGEGFHEGFAGGSSISGGEGSRELVGTSPLSSTSVAARGTRLPNDFTVSTEMKKWAREKTPHVNVPVATERFVDYWRATPGARGRKLDWVATWRNWLRREEDDPRNRSRPVAKPDVSADEREPVEVVRDLWRAADAQGVASILRIPYYDEGQPPSDTTPHTRWIRESRKSWIEAHHDAAVNALSERGSEIDCEPPRKAAPSGIAKKSPEAGSVAVRRLKTAKGTG